jgi:hypothetical protein
MQHVQIPTDLSLKMRPGYNLMDELEVLEVKGKKAELMFLDLPRAIYKGDSNWIPCVRSEVTNVFDPSVNPYFKNGTARRWIVVAKSGEVLGRIAAFVKYEKMYDGDDIVGCIGFFETFNNQSVSFLLFDTALEWLVEFYHVTIIEGPVNFGENDKFWGLLISGFTPPSYGMNYNPAYYQNLFESYGFEIHYRQFTNYIDLEKPLPERFNRIAQRVLNNKHNSFKPFRYKYKDNFINDFVTIYNQAWSTFRNFHPIDIDVVKKSLAEMKAIVEEDFIWFAYVDKKPVGFLLGIPDVNEIIKYSGDKFNLWGKVKFLFYKYTKGFSRVRVVVMGIVPEFQNHGLESGLVACGFKEGKKRPNFKHVELSWVGDFNDKMIAIHNAMGAVEDKVHATFRKIVECT